ncbi:hypothetical protein ACFX13_035744 [Malus domestica]
MGNTSKDLLQFEHKRASTSPLESTLLVCKNASTKKAQPEGKPGPALPLPKSQVLGLVRDFLGVISEANERLKQDAKDNPENYDIEVLTGNESQVELMLGVADLQTPEAVAAAESAIVGCQPVIPLAINSSGEESEDSSDGDSSSDDSDDEDGSDDSSSNDNDDEDSDEIKDDTIDKEDKKTTSHARLKTRKSDKDNSMSDDAGNNRSQKRPKIVELSRKSCEI